jgi:hypothetical protein
MRVVRNIGYVKKRRRAGKLIVFSGIFMLIGAWFITLLYPPLFLLSTIGLAVGFIFFNGGMQQMSRWSRKPRTDEILDTEMTRLNDRFALIHYPEIHGRRPDHALIMPNGMLVITPREVPGEMSVHGKVWRRKGNPLARLFVMGGPQLGNPTIENQEQIKTLNAWLASKDLSAGDIHGVIVFVAENVEVEIVDPEVPVLHISELTDYIRQISAGDVTLTGRNRDAIIEALSGGNEVETNAAAPARPRKKVRAA